MKGPKDKKSIAERRETVENVRVRRDNKKHFSKLKETQEVERKRNNKRVSAPNDGISIPLS